MDAYRKAAASQDLVSRKVGEREKTGVFTGGYAINPATGKQIPVWIADYVLMEYGTGAIMAVPGHDERDFEFAGKFDLPIVQRGGAGRPRPRCPPSPQGDGDTGDYAVLPFLDNESGVLVNSGQFDGMTVPDAKRAIIEWLEQKGAGKAVVNFRLHDWCISRQRYWGPPIPIIYCDDARRRPGPGEGPAGRAPDHRRLQAGRHRRVAARAPRELVPRPVPGLRQARPARDRRERHVPRSAWYHLRYPSTEFDDRPFDPARTQEVAAGHHLHRRQRARRAAPACTRGSSRWCCTSWGTSHFDEPYKKFRAHGLIVKDGAKMSKSRGNVVIPDEYINKWGADTFRMYLMFLGPFQEGGDFRDEGISGPRRFLDKVWALVGDACRTHADDEVRHETLVKYHQTVKRVTEGMEELRYNTSIAALMELVNALRADTCTQRTLVEGLVVMLAPFAPHFAEESWERLGHDSSVFDARWPAWNEGLTVEDQVEVAVQVNGKTRGRVTVPRDAEQGAVVEAAQRDAAVRRFTEGKEVRKVVYVPNRLLNLVVG